MIIIIFTLGRTPANEQNEIWRLKLNMFKICVTDSQ